MKKQITKKKNKSVRTRNKILVQNKNSNLGITLIALVITIIVLLILSGVTLATIVGQDGVINKAIKAKEETAEAEEEERNNIDQMLDKIGEHTGESYSIVKKVNRPQMLSGMTKVMFKDPTATEKGSIIKEGQEGFDENNWYDYQKQNWANAMTEDDSMWVWIPRFAYKINTSTQTTDIVFLVGTTDSYYDEQGNLIENNVQRCETKDQPVNTANTEGNKYTVHPAFTNESSIDYRNGGWDKELTGIWVAKFEAGYEGTNSPTTLPVFKGTTYSKNYITNSQAYTLVQRMTENNNMYGFTSGVDSHLMKNSEWGAVAYLSKSKYGLYNKDIYVNNININNTEGNGAYAVTGCTTATETNSSPGPKTTTMATIQATTGNTASDGIYTWNQLGGIGASSSGTIYGIYDLSGGVWERTAAYVMNVKGDGTVDAHSYLKTFGESMTCENGNYRTKSTKYATIYPKNENGLTDSQIDTASQQNFAASTKIYGDAVRETNNGKAGTSQGGWNVSSWYSDYSCFPALHAPFFVRGGLWNYFSVAGLFYFYRHAGSSGSSYGFRAVLVGV